MKSLNMAIFGCGTVGGGVAAILTEINGELSQRAGKQLNLKKIVELSPEIATKRFNLSPGLFCSNGKDLSPEEANRYIDEIIQDENIHLVVETIGGTSDFVYNLVVRCLEAKKHVVSANKALLAERGKGIFEAAANNHVTIGFEAAVCGAIPIIKTIKESFTGDTIQSISGIFNGTSNYILSRMQNENLAFDDALKLAQENGYAEADPTLDINGGDAGHKLVILIKLAFGLDVNMEELNMTGIENIGEEEMEFAKEIDCKIKLICYAKKVDGKIFATVSPMMVRSNNFLSEVNGATNAVRVVNQYSGNHILVGEGAGSSETASSIVADIVYIARYADKIANGMPKSDFDFMDAKHFEFRYIIAFDTEDLPGITGKITTAIGNQNINIDTVSHNKHDADGAVFSIATMECTLGQIGDAIAEIKQKYPGILQKEPKVMPILG
jgi:homoserine dehydrogenase